MDTEAQSLAVACSLTEPELRARRNTVLQKIRQAALETIEVESGYAYRFHRTMSGSIACKFSSARTAL